MDRPFNWGHCWRRVGVLAQIIHGGRERSYLMNTETAIFLLIGAVAGYYFVGHYMHAGSPV